MYVLLTSLLHTILVSGSNLECCAGGVVHEILLHGDCTPGKKAENVKSAYRQDSNSPMLTRSARLILKVIGTHNGTFHCDEALAVYMLRLTEAYRDAGPSDDN